MNTYLASDSISEPRASQSARGFIGFLRALDSALSTALNTLSIWDRRHRDRQHLASLDHRMLRDIGITSADVEHEASKPFWRG